MTTWTDPRWVGLAKSAAVQLSANHPTIIAAILAQFSCEQGTSAPWPPALNNPGNLTSAIGHLDGQPHSVGRYIGGGAYLYRYATPQAGALAYATYLLRSSRYTNAILAARRGDARGFLTAVCNAGYGTRLTCCLNLLPHIPGVSVPVPTVPRWRCLAGSVNVRSQPTTASAIVGSEHAGSIVSGTVVSGGVYRANGNSYSSWIRLGSGRFTARAYYSAA